MQQEDQIPDPQLMESMRSVGYSLEAALADLIDNSLAAGATVIDIAFRSTDGPPVVAIIDNGRGMDANAAKVALKLAGSNRGQVRDSLDLGRFGLGLKTASLSQARCLTVVTRDATGTTGLQWDLDRVAGLRRWSMGVLDEQDMAGLQLFDHFKDLRTGTMVLWERLDLLLSDTENVSSHLADRMGDAANHLELVFHRFISGEPGIPAVSISINGKKLTKVDPFLERNPATQSSPIEILGSAEAPITVRAFTLPHLSKISLADRKYGRVGERMRETQGFYVYRGRRLIEWGSWFRLAPKDELAKLARVRIDIPNSLDGEWSLDIKKSRAVPPESVRRELRRLIQRIVGQSHVVHNYRGRPDESQEGGEFIWALTKNREGYAYSINREHPFIRDVAMKVGNHSNSLESLLDLIEDTFPVHDLYARMSRDEQPATREFTDEFLLSAAREMWSFMGVAGGMPFPDFAKTIARAEPFRDHADAADWLSSLEVEIKNG
jgi:hypothetical protein